MRLIRDIISILYYYNSWYENIFSKINNKRIILKNIHFLHVNIAI